ncbi:hypothetical protein BKA93DRAFT_826261 [Sparassis latifolia]
MPPLLEYRLKYPSLGLHSEGVTCVDIDPTGKYVAAGGSDGRIFISNLDDGRLHHLVLTRSPVTAVIWVEADWPTLICCCQSGIILTVVITLDTLDATYFRARNHRIAGIDIQIWQGRHKYDWEQSRTLGRPLTNRSNSREDVSLAAMHWRITSENVIQLVASYHHHRIQLWDTRAERVIRVIAQSSSL